MNVEEVKAKATADLVEMCSRGNVDATLLLQLLEANADINTNEYRFFPEDEDDEDPDDRRQPPIVDLIDVDEVPNMKCIQILIGANADLELTDDCGYSVLARAISKNHLSLVKLILDPGGNPKHVGEVGGTPMAQHGIFQADTKCLELLLERKGDVNAQSAIGETALMWAARGGYLPAVQFLVSYPDTNLSLRAENGKRALEYAELNKRDNKAVIVELLKLKTKAQDDNSCVLI